MTPPQFDFEEAPSWDVSQGTFLGEGNHVVEVKEAGRSLSKNGGPQIALVIGNNLGEKKDWLTYSEKNGVSKVATLFRAAGVQLLNADVEEDGQIAEAKVQQLIGKKVGAVLRNEPSFKDPTKVYAEVQGYLPAADVKPLPTQAIGTGGGATASADGDDIAF
jgi:hypothetical protein